MQNVTPKKIISPWTGSWCDPQIKVREQDGKVITEAWWYCPESGRFITKGVVKVEEKSSTHD